MTEGKIAGKAGYFHDFLSIRTAYRPHQQPVVKFAYEISLKKYRACFAGEFSKTSVLVPKLWLNSNVKNFYDFTIDDEKFENYEANLIGFKILAAI